MDLVYLNAELIIVAASGDCADAGLPGVSSVSRTPQPHAEIGNHVLVSQERPQAQDSGVNMELPLLDVSSSPHISAFIGLNRGTSIL